jgi:hypothetical protein
MQHSEIRDRLLTRLEADPTDLLWQAAATAAINEGQRLMAFLALPLEATREFVLTPGVSTYRMLAEGWSDWLVPLRVRVSNDTATGATAEFDAQEPGAAMFNEQAYTGLTVTAAPKLRPATIYQLTALDPAWLNATGAPTRYGVIGADLLFLDKSPVQEGTKLLITYARSPVPLVADGDVPEIPDADHQALIQYGEFRLRANEGGQELASAAGLLKSFLECAKQRADQVRARSAAQGYDVSPAELKPALRQNPRRGEK